MHMQPAAETSAERLGDGLLRRPSARVCGGARVLFPALDMRIFGGREITLPEPRARAAAQDFFNPADIANVQAG